MKKVYLNTLTPEEIIKRLKAGEVVKFDNSSCIVSMVDGVIISKNKGSFMFNDCFTVSYISKSYFEEEEKFEITETGLYKTRDGRQVYVSVVDDESDYPVRGIVSGSIGLQSWTREGINMQGETLEIDIVAKWED